MLPHYVPLFRDPVARLFIIFFSFISFSRLVKVYSHLSALWWRVGQVQCLLSDMKQHTSEEGVGVGLGGGGQSVWGKHHL